MLFLGKSYGHIRKSYRITLSSITNLHHPSLLLLGRSNLPCHRLRLRHPTKRPRLVLRRSTVPPLERSTAAAAGSQLLPHLVARAPLGHARRRSRPSRPMADCVACCHGGEALRGPK